MTPEVWILDDFLQRYDEWVERDEPSDDWRVAVRATYLLPCASQSSPELRSRRTVRRLSLEQALETIAPDEVVEATPKSVRLRKTVLDQMVRGRATKRAKVASGA